MITVEGQGRPHLIAVHLDPRAPEFRPTAALWKERRAFADRVYVSSGFHPYPFKGKSAEIRSPSGRIIPGRIPVHFTSPNFVLVGGLLSDQACLLRAFSSLVAMGYYTAGQVVIRMPLDCTYALPKFDKVRYARRKNSFDRILGGHFGNNYMVSFDNALISGENSAPARLDWYSTASKMLPML